MPASLRREIGQLLIGSLPATTITAEMRSLAREFQLGGVTIFRAQHRSAGTSRGTQSRSPVTGVRAAVVGRSGSGRRAGRAVAVRRSPNGRQWRRWDAAAMRRSRAASRRRWPPSSKPWVSPSITPPSSTSTPIRRIPSSAIEHSARMPGPLRGSAPLSSAACRTTALPPAASISRAWRYVGRFPPRAAARRASARSHPPCRAACRFAKRSATMSRSS